MPPGPNNPVGIVWIALSAKGYGIHGTPDPEAVSKRASHGCIRLTNWDALELARHVRKGTPVHIDAGSANSAIMLQPETPPGADNRDAITEIELKLTSNPV